MSTHTPWGLRAPWIRVAVAVLVAALGVTARATTVSAQNVVVTLDLTGSGAGTVTSSPAGLNCSGTAQTCTGTFAPNTTVTLTATPSTGHTFGGWGGACAGTSGCAIVTSTGLLVAATFHGAPAYVFYHQDAIGSVRAVTSEAGAVVARYDYEPFGEAQPGLGGPIRFGGKALDSETQFSYFGARFQRNILGRFTTDDPVMDTGAAVLAPQRWNRYAYALNNPLKYVDPDGKEPVSIALAVLWGAYEIASSIYDAYSTYQTLRDGNASTTEKVTTVGLAAAGIFLPGGGYGTAGRAAIRHTDDVVDASRAYRHTFQEMIEQIRENGLRLNAEGKIFATPTKGLSPLVAQIELSLPGNRLRDLVIKIDLNALRRDGYQIPEPRRVTGQYGRPGGGWEYVFDYDIPDKYLIWD